MGSRYPHDGGVALAIVAYEHAPVERAHEGRVGRGRNRDAAIGPINGTPDRAPQKLASTVGPANIAAGSAGEVFCRHLEALVHELRRREDDAREDEQDGVRRMRVATRRLRSALTTYRPILVTARTEPLRDELRWLGTQLGEPRDAELLRDQLAAAVESLPPDLRTGAMFSLLEVELQARHRDAHGRLLTALATPRYIQLVDALGQLVDYPPLAMHATRPAASEVHRLVRRTVRRVRKMASLAEAAVDGADRERALHEVRKAAKRSRYAAESASTTLGRPATKLARRMKHLQDVLGEVQDSIASRRLLREIGAVADRAHQNAFTFGVLYGREEMRSRVALNRYEDALGDALREDWL